MVLHIQIIWCNKVTGVIATLYMSTSVDNRFHMFIFSCEYLEVPFS